MKQRRFREKCYNFIDLNWFKERKNCKVHTKRAHIPITSTSFSAVRGESCGLTVCPFMDEQREESCGWWSISLIFCCILSHQCLCWRHICHSNKVRPRAHVCQSHDNGIVLRVIQIIQHAAVISQVKEMKLTLKCEEKWTNEDTSRIHTVC